MSIRVTTGDGLTTYKVVVPLLLWRPRLRRPDGDSLTPLADHSARLSGIPFLGKIAWLGLLIYLLGMTLIRLASAILFVVEWVGAVLASVVVVAFRLMTRRPFLIRATLVSYIGAHKPQQGMVSVGSPDRPTERPVRIEWIRPSLPTAMSARQVMADHIKANQFADTHR